MLDYFKITNQTVICILFVSPGLTAVRTSCIMNSVTLDSLWCAHCYISCFVMFRSSWWVLRRRAQSLYAGTLSIIRTPPPRSCGSLTPRASIQTCWPPVETICAYGGYAEDSSTHQIVVMNDCTSSQHEMKMDPIYVLMLVPGLTVNIH